MDTSTITDTLEQHLTHIQRVASVTQRWMTSYNATTRIVMFVAPYMTVAQLKELEQNAIALDHCREEMIEAMTDMARDVTQLEELFTEFEKENARE